jgi:L-cysteine desulfidase
MCLQRNERNYTNMDKSIYNNYLNILRNELLVALGCTEPIAIAFATAKAKEVLGKMPKRCEIYCSGNIIKNVKGVTVPNTGHLKGVNAAAIAGITGGDASKILEVLESMTEETIKETRELLETDFCKTFILNSTSNLHIRAIVYSEEDSVEVEIKDSHTNITQIIHNGKIIFEKSEEQSCIVEDFADKSLLNVRDIIEFAQTVDLEEVSGILKNQIMLNSAISQEGLTNNYGVNVGRTLMAFRPDDICTKAKARAAAASDARMSGCSLPVVINSGSGNQGLTVSLPVIEYAKHLGSSSEQLLRALIISNLVSIHQKAKIGRLSAYCGAVSAAAGSGAGIAYLYGGEYEEICNTITNTIANVGGIVCDGAKPSCAAKIASSVDAAIMGMNLAFSKQCYSDGEGLVMENIEKTIESIGRLGAVGMKDTDVEILKIMIGL